MPANIPEWIIGRGGGGGVEVWIGRGGMWRGVSNSGPWGGFYPRKEVSLEKYSQAEYQPAVPVIVDTDFEEKKEENNVFSILYYNTFLPYLHPNE